MKGYSVLSAKDIVCVHCERAPYKVVTQVAIRPRTSLCAPLVLYMP